MRSPSAKAFGSERMAARGPTPHGVLIIDKPRGPTSHDMVARARKVFQTRRVGHAGTLDPMATGVLVLLFGEATKLSAVLTTARKEYVATVHLGVSTTSGDADGQILRQVALGPGDLSQAQIEQALDGERARRVQVPPQVSAIKVGGVRAHAIARSGGEVELEPRDVVVHELEVLDCSLPYLTVRLLVSKGYYVRSFARDLGSTLGVPASLSALRRTKSGDLGLDGAAPGELKERLPLRDLGTIVRQTLCHLQVTPEEHVRATQGKLLSLDLNRLSRALDPDLPVAAMVGDEILALLEEVPAHEAEAAGRWEGLEPRPGALLFRVRRGFQLSASSDEPEADGG
jgi:tRNA pseudouridine55 synthase